MHEDPAGGGLSSAAGKRGPITRGSGAGWCQGRACASTRTPHAVSRTCPAGVIVASASASAPAPATAQITVTQPLANWPGHWRHVSPAAAHGRRPCRSCHRRRTGGGAGRHSRADCASSPPVNARHVFVPPATSHRCRCAWPRLSPRNECQWPGARWAAGSARLPSLELRIVRKERREHPAEAVTQPRREVIEDQLRTVGGRPAVAGDALGEDDGGQLEVGGRAVREFDHPHRLGHLRLRAPLGRACAATRMGGAPAARARLLGSRGKHWKGG